MILPCEFLTRMKNYLGDEYDEFVSSYEKPGVKGLRFNAIGENISPIAYFDTSLCTFEQVEWEENGYFCNLDEFEKAAPGKQAYHEAGAYYIQEPSAMAPVFYLDAAPGDKILDLCASPGGKSTQIGTKMQSNGILVSNEISRKRADVLSENIERLGIRNALVLNEDPKDLADRFYGFFDKILVDAPCSGEGMFRRLDTAVSEWSENSVKKCAKRQGHILDSAAQMLKCGGVLVYSTCTFSKEENEDNIAAFLNRNPDFMLDDIKLFDGMEKGFNGIGARLYPHKVNGEGHFVCRLIKRTDSGVKNNAGKTDALIKREQGVSKKDMLRISGMYSFVRENVSGNIRDKILNGKLTLFGDKVYLLPDDCPALNGLKVLRAGLLIGTILKNRFEPSHALAMALKKDEYINCVDIKDNDVIYRYLRGEGINISDTGLSIENGLSTNHSCWVLICYRGLSVGFGKAVGGVIKNHYPKGLRKRW